ncbi:MAG: MATE family efflux transporter [Chitinivibrionales bacterium]|nr:MATE family efflux transporter [Chitinivibrionales bacterium]MBD3395544.1 MATE family efflux transporter [Chitinivibrionales bacterium]
MHDRHKARLVDGHEGKLLLKLALPMVLGILGMNVFHLVDTIYIGMLGREFLAAIAFTFPVVLIVNGIAMGIGIGTAAVVSRAIGKGDHRRVQRLTTDSLLLAFCLVVLVAIAGFLTIDPVFRLMHAQKNLLPHIRQYMRIWYAGAAFVVVPMVGNNAIRATGDTKTPGVVMVLAFGVNALLDPVLIFGLGPFPRLELAGAALATVISRSVTLAIALWVLVRREHMLSFARPAIRSVLESWKGVLFIGLPTGATHAIMPLGLGIITRLLADFGPHVVGGFGAATRVEMFGLVPIWALGSGLSPFIGQNWGAGKLHRVQRGIRSAQMFSAAWGAAMLVLLFALAPVLALMFSRDRAVTGTIVKFLRIASWGYPFLGIGLLAANAMNVLNRPLHSASLNVLYMFGLMVPLSFLFSRLMGVTGIFTGFAVARALAGTTAFFWLRAIVRREKDRSQVRSRDKARGLN